MLEIVRSGFYSNGREKLFEEIRLLAEKETPVILIVPEQQTVMTEGVLSKIIPPRSTKSLEVTNFTRLANTVFRALGGLSGEYCDSAKSALIMWRALTELSPLLTMTAAKREVSAGLVTSVMRAVSEMQSLGIAPTDLATAADAVADDKRLSDKLSDLSRVFALYKSLLSEKYADSGDDAEAMIKKLTENPDFLSDSQIFVEGFTSFTEPQYSLLGLLSKRCRIKVLLNVSPECPDAFEFTELRECESRLVSEARRQGSEIKIIKEPRVSKGQSEALADICAELWTSRRPDKSISVSARNSKAIESKTAFKDRDFDNSYLHKNDILRIFEAQTPFDECEFICADIRRRVMGGASYSDFAIVCRSTDKYSGILDCALSRAKIPSFSSFRRDIADFEIVKLIYSAYSAIRKFSKEDVITYAKCPLSGLSREECDELEMYVNKWQISGSRFTDGELWSMNPEGYTTNRPDGTEEKLFRINCTKKKLIDPLLRLEGRTENAKTAREQTSVLLDFLLEIGAEEALQKRAELLDSLGERELATENRALWGIIVNAMDALYEVLGDTPCNRDAFLSQLKATLAFANVASIPAFRDEVTVGRADMLRLHGKPHVYMLGVNAGEFPLAVGENSFFSEHDKQVLSSIGLSVKPETLVKDARELYVFSRVFSYATETVTLSYSACNTKFKATTRAEVIDRITLLTGDEAKPIKISELPLNERIYSAEDAVSEIGELGESYPSVREALIAAGKEREVKISEGKVSNSSLCLDEATRDALYNKPLSLTQTRIDKYVSCPFGHFCKYTVGLSADERAEFDAASIGSFIHAILENFFRALSAEGKHPSDLSPEEKGELTREAAKKYVEDLGKDVTKGSPRTKTKIERLCRAAMPVVDGLCEEFSESLFEPRFFELALKREDETAPSPVTFSSEGGDISIFGVIDRVDTYKKGDDVYVRVVDYKTGHKVFSPDDMAEGTNLQMFLYLKSLIDTEKTKFKESVGAGEGGRLIPAGVIYVKTAVSDVEVTLPDDSLAEETVKANQKREGMVLNDPEILSAMKLKFTPVYSERTPDKVSSTKEKFLFTEDGFDEIMQTVENSVISVADRMRSGRIEAAPKQNGASASLPCEYCEFKPICRSVVKK